MTVPWPAPDENPWAYQAPVLATPVPGPSWVDRLAVDVAAAFAAVAVLVLLGSPLALVWRAVAPHVAVTQSATGPQLAAPEGKTFFAADGWFVVVTVLAGLACGVVAWRFLRDRGPAGPVGLAGGSLAAAFVTRAVGHRLVVDGMVHRFCTSPGIRCHLYDGTVQLRATVAVVAWPLASLAAFVVCAIVLDRDPS